MNGLFIKMPLRLQDAIVCNGLVRTLAEHRHVIVPASTHNLTSVRFMYRDVPNIYVTRVLDVLDMDFQADQQMKNDHNVMLLTRSEKEWDKGYYAGAGVPFDCRWTRFHVQRDPEIETVIPQRPYCFVSHDPVRKMTIDQSQLPKGMHIVEPDLNGHIFEWMWAIEHAQEIHCIDNAMLALIDSKYTEAERKVFHPYSRKSNPPSIRGDWEIGEEPDKQLKMAQVNTKGPSKGRSAHSKASAHRKRIRSDES